MTKPSRESRLQGIEGLRAIAASSIVIVHVWAFSPPSGEVPGGDVWIGDVLSALSVGVTLFFTLSGFLLYRPFAAAIARGVPHMPIRTYLRNRVLRIAPAYWAILFMTAVVLGSVYVRTADGGLEIGRLSDPLELLQAALLLQDYRPSTLLNGIAPAWSLAVEAVFYVTLPLLVLAVARIARGIQRRGHRLLLLLAPAVFLLVLGLTGKWAAANLFPAAPTAGYDANWHSVIERSFWAQADLFSFGMIAAVLHAEMGDGRLKPPPGWRPFAVFAAVAIFLPCAWTIDKGEHSYLIQNTGEALALAILLAAIVMPGEPGRGPTTVARWLDTPILAAIGVASYSVFLWHLPLIDWLAKHDVTFEGWAGLVLNLAIVVPIVGVLSALTYRFVERPALRRKRSSREPASMDAAAP